jgi:hypothetical protein
VFSLLEVAAEPVRYRQVGADQGAQVEVIVAELGEGLPVPVGRAGGITAKTRELGAHEGDCPGDVSQDAPYRSGRRLLGLVAGRGVGALSVVQQWLDHFDLAADDGDERLGGAAGRVVRRLAASPW